MRQFYVNAIYVLDADVPIAYGLKKNHPLAQTEEGWFIYRKECLGPDDIKDAWTRKKSTWGKDCKLWRDGWQFFEPSEGSQATDELLAAPKTLLRQREGCLTDPHAFRAPKLQAVKN